MRELSRSAKIKTAMVLVLGAAMLIAATVAFAGCGGTGASGLSESQIGIPVYPGAVKVDLASQRQIAPGGSNSAGGRLRNWSSAGSSAGGPWSSAGGPGPRSSAGSGRGFSSAGNRPFGGQLRAQTTLSTPDSQAKVAAWYNTKLSGKPGFAVRTVPAGLEAAIGDTTVYTFASGKTTKMVTIRKDTRSGKTGTIIAVRDMPQGLPSFPGGGQDQQSF